MTPKLLRELKEVQFSCTSPDSISINQPSLLTSSGIGGRAIDRCSPHLRDPLRAKSLNPLLLSQPTNKPKSTPNSPSPSSKPKNKKPIINSSHHDGPGLSPASSRRYLLGATAKSEDFAETEASVTANEPSRFQSPKIEEFSVYVGPFESAKIEASSPFASSSASVPTKPQPQQVVVLTVSLHCKGCEGKVRKHISKMQGVTSFTTDLVNKKVTVVGDVTPLGVLNSISKVKNAQLWPSQPRSSSSSVSS